MTNYMYDLPAPNTFDAMEGEDKYVSDLVRKVQIDKTDMSAWLEKATQAYLRRFAEGDEGGGPWLGASEVNMPTSDLYVNQLKPVYINGLLGGPRIVTMQPLSAQAYEHRHAASRVMEHLLRGGGYYSMSDFTQQMSQAVDSMCTFGVGFLKTYYSYKLRRRTELVRRDSLPGVFQKMQFITHEPNEAELQLGMQSTTEEQMQTFGIPNPIFPEAFDALKEIFRAKVIELFELDPEQDLDKKAISSILKWMRGGTKTRTITFDRLALAEHAPRVVNVPVQNLIVPIGAQADFTRLERLTHRERLTRTEFIERAREEEWDEDDVKYVLEHSPSADPYASANWDGWEELSSEQQSRWATMYGTGDQDCYEVWEIYHYEEITKGHPELIVTTVQPDSGKMLNERPFIYEHGEMPFSAITFEVNEGDIRSSRGVPEVLKDIEAHVTAHFRALENNMTITTNPTMAYDPDMVENPNDLEWFPGLNIPASNPTQSLAPVLFPQTDIPIERLAQFYLQWPERLLGGVDNSNLTTGPQPERRTATEIQSVEGQRSRVVGLRINLFMEQMQRVFRHVWSLYKQFGPREIYTNLTGEEPLPVTQAMTMGDYAMVPFGAVGSMDPVQKQNEALQRLSVASELAPVLSQDVRYELDLGGMFVDWLRLQDPTAAQTAIRVRNEQQVQEMLQMQQQQAAADQQMAQTAKAAMANLPLTPEQALALTEEIAKLAGRNKELQMPVQKAQQSQDIAQRNAALNGA